MTCQEQQEQREPFKTNAAAIKKSAKRRSNSTLACLTCQLDNLPCSLESVTTLPQAVGDCEECQQRSMTCRKSVISGTPSQASLLELEVKLEQMENFLNGLEIPGLGDGNEKLQLQLEELNILKNSIHPANPQRKRKKTLSSGSLNPSVPIAVTATTTTTTTTTTMMKTANFLIEVEQENTMNQLCVEEKTKLLVEFFDKYGGERSIIAVIHPKRFFLYGAGVGPLRDGVASMGIKTLGPPPCLLNAMIGLVLMHHHHHAGEGGVNNRAECFMKQAREKLDVLTPSMEAAQTLILLLYYELQNFQFKSAGLTAAICTRMCTTLNYNRLDEVTYLGEDDQVTLETKRRIWWSCFILDGMATLSNGLPLCINIRDCLSKLPGNHTGWINEQANTANTNFLSLNLENSLDFLVHGFLDYLTMMISLGAVLNKVLRYVYRPGNNKREAALPDSEFSKLDEILAKWQQSILSLVPTDYTPETLLPHALFQLSVFCLHKTNLPAPEGFRMPHSLLSLRSYYRVEKCARTLVWLYWQHRKILPSLPRYCLFILQQCAHFYVNLVFSPFTAQELWPKAYKNVERLGQLMRLWRVEQLMHDLLNQVAVREHSRQDALALRDRLMGSAGMEDLLDFEAAGEVLEQDMVIRARDEEEEEEEKEGDAKELLDRMFEEIILNK